MGVGDQRHTPAALPPRESACTHWVGSWMDPRASVDEFWRRENSLLPPGVKPQTIKLVDSRYTEDAPPPPPPLYHKLLVLISLSVLVVDIACRQHEGHFGGPKVLFLIGKAAGVWSWGLTSSDEFRIRGASCTFTIHSPPHTIMAYTGTTSPSLKRASELGFWPQVSDSWTRYVLVIWCSSHFCAQSRH